MNYCIECWVIVWLWFSHTLAVKYVQFNLVYLLSCSSCSSYCSWGPHKTSTTWPSTEQLQTRVTQTQYNTTYRKQFEQVNYWNMDHNSRKMRRRRKTSRVVISLQSMLKGNGLSSSPQSWVNVVFTYHCQLYLSLFIIIYFLIRETL